MSENGKNKPDKQYKKKFDGKKVVDLYSGSKFSLDTVYYNTSIVYRLSQ